MKMRVCNGHWRGERRPDALEEGGVFGAGASGIGAG
jgi:hypothetical protein